MPRKLQEAHLKYNSTGTLKIKWWKKKHKGHVHTAYSYTKLKWLLKLGKVDMRAKEIIRDKTDIT